MRFSHIATAYILRWNKPDWKTVIGVFLTEEHLDKFIADTFRADELQYIKTERGPYYRPYDGT